MSLMPSSAEDDVEGSNFSLNGANRQGSCKSWSGSYVPSEQFIDTGISSDLGCQTYMPSCSASLTETVGLDTSSQLCTTHLGDFCPCTSFQTGSKNGLVNVVDNSNCRHDSDENNQEQSEVNCSCDSCDKCTGSSKPSQPCACLLESVDDPLRTANCHTADCDISVPVHLPDGRHACNSTDSTVALPVLDDAQHTESHGSSQNLCSVLSGACSSITSSFFLLSLSRREKLVLLCLAVVDLTSQMCLSIMAPFFPAEAINKGVSTTISGWIFGVFALVQFVASPLFGKTLPHFGSRFLIVAGQFFSGGCVLLFGCVDQIKSDNGSDLFVIYCFVLRIFLAIGCTASATASFAITASVYPANVATVFGLLETASGLGMMIGPALGGLLYEVGGFRLPFIVLGGLMILTVPINYWSLPAGDGESRNIQTVSILQILRIPAIIVVCFAVIVAGLVWSILDPTLAPHLDQFDVSPGILGLLFLLMSAFYAVFSPIWGWIADRMNDCSPMLIAGFFLSAAGLLLLGPSPWIGFSASDNYMWLNVIALVVLGISVSLALVPTFDKILDAVERAGIDDSFAMYSAVSGIWGSCYALGDFIGPSLGGWLVDKKGFPLCMSYIAAVCAAMGVLVLMLYIWERCCNEQVCTIGADGVGDKPLNDVSDDDSVESSERTRLVLPRRCISESPSVYRGDSVMNQYAAFSSNSMSAVDQPFVSDPV